MAWMASGVQGMLEPSKTALQPLDTSSLAESVSISFWVAQGMAMSQGTDQMPAQPSTYLAVGT